VPGTTIDRQCGSSQQAVHFAAQGVMSGTQDLVVAGGSQAMNAIPISAAMLAAEPYGFSNPFNTSPGWVARYGDGILNQINSAEMIANKWGLTREADGRICRRFAPRAQAAGMRLVRQGIAPMAELAATKRSARRRRWKVWRAAHRAGRRDHHRRHFQPELRWAPPRCWSPPNAR
jgi:acetyl-CoA C-acetyltransferase